MGVKENTIVRTLEALPEGIILLDTKMRAQYFNQNSKHLLPLLQMNDNLDVHYPEVSRDFKDYVESALEDTATKLERYSFKGNGYDAVLSVSFYPVAGDTPDEIFCLVVLRDLTEQVSLHSDLESRFAEVSQQLSRARKYQEALFTNDYTDKFISCQAFGQPASELSGDFFNISVMQERHLILLGDVQSHGIDVAMKAVMLQQLCLMSVEEVPVPSNIMTRLNDFVTKDQQEEFWTCCMFIGCFDPLEKTLYYCRSGVPEPILVRANGSVEVLEEGDMPLGYFNGESYHNSLVSIEPGDRLLVFSDGVIEINKDGDTSSMFGHDELQAAYLEFCSLYNGHNWEKIVSIVEEYHGSSRFPDDLTLAEILFS